MLCLVCGAQTALIRNQLPKPWVVMACSLAKFLYSATTAVVMTYFCGPYSMHTNGDKLHSGALLFRYLDQYKVQLSTAPANGFCFIIIII